MFVIDEAYLFLARLKFYVVWVTQYGMAFGLVHYVTNIVQSQCRELIHHELCHSAIAAKQGIDYLM